MMTDAEAVALLKRDGSESRGSNVKFPTTDEGWCAWFRALDLKFGTDPDSMPLGHNYRCPIHGHKSYRKAS